MEETWLQELREEFPVTKKAAFFDIAYENCGAEYMKTALERYFFDKADITPGMTKAGGGGKGRTVEVIARAREALADFLGADGAKSIAFTPNTCQAISLAVMGIEYAPGDNIVTAAYEHVSVMMPCLNMERFGVQCRLVGKGSDLMVTADELLAACDEHTKAVVVSYVQSSSGYRIDLEYLVKKCHERGIRVITDAIQALGLIPVNVTQLGVDALAGSPYKGMLGTEGMGFLCLSKEFRRNIKPLFASYNAGMTVDRDNGRIVMTDEDDARKLEAGTIGFMSIYILDEALKRIKGIGMDKITAHVSECFDKLQKGLKDRGFEIAAPADKQHSCASFLVKTADEKAMTRFLESHGVFVSAGKTGYVRVSVTPFTSDDDIAKLFEVAEAYAKQ